MYSINTQENTITLSNDRVPYNACSCGSELPWFPLYDARGIYCQSVCNSCEKTVMSKYRKEIFTDSNYECEEQIDAD